LTFSQDLNHHHHHHHYHYHHPPGMGHGSCGAYRNLPDTLACWVLRAPSPHPTHTPTSLRRWGGRWWWCWGRFSQGRVAAPRAGVGVQHHHHHPLGHWYGVQPTVLPVKNHVCAWCEANASVLDTVRAQVSPGRHHPGGGGGGGCERWGGGLDPPPQPFHGKSELGWRSACRPTPPAIMRNPAHPSHPNTGLHPGSSWV